MPNRAERRRGNPNGSVMPQNQTIVAQKTYVGPMPAPEDMERYKSCSSDLPGRIMSLAEESSRRETMKVENQARSLENQKESLANQKLAIEGNNSVAKLGLVFAFVLSFLCLVSAAIFVIKGLNVQAFVASIIPASLFFKAIFGRNTGK